MHSTQYNTHPCPRFEATTTTCAERRAQVAGCGGAGVEDFAGSWHLAAALWALTPARRGVESAISTVLEPWQARLAHQGWPASEGEALSVLAASRALL